MVRHWRRALPAAVLAVALAVGALAWSRGEDASGAERGPALQTGAFRGLAWPASGRAELRRSEDGRARLTFTGFATPGAPELYVYVVPGAAAGGDIRGGVRIGRLRAVFGNQVYDVRPAAVPPGRASIVVWCDLCHKPWGMAALAPPPQV
jgi:hypothetical protein